MVPSVSNRVIVLPTPTVVIPVNLNLVWPAECIPNVPDTPLIASDAK